MNRPDERSRTSAFTLIEMLVGMTVGILLVVILFQIFNVASAAWQRSENQIDAYREARAALQLMTRDFSSVVAQFPVNPAALTAVPAQGGAAPTLVLDKYPVPDPARDDLDLNNEEAYFLTTVSNTGSSSLCAVGYFCQWLPDIPPGSDPQGLRTPRSYALFRQFLGSGKHAVAGVATQAGLYDLLKLATNIPIGFMDLFVRSRPNAESGLTNSTLVRATAVEMAAYVWDLQFRIDTNLKAARGAAQPPDDHGDLPAGGVTRQYTSRDGMQHPLRLPPYVEIRFKALGSGGVRRLEGNNSVNRSTWWNANSPFYTRTIQPSLQQFVARVPLQNVEAGLIPAP